MEVAQKTYICSFWKTYKMKEVIVRTISGVLYISIILFAMFTSREWFMGLFFVLAIITLSEFLKLVYLSSYVAYFLLAAASYFLSYNIFSKSAVLLFLILCGFVNVLLLRDIIINRRIPMFENKKYITVVFYIIGGFVFLTLIPTVNIRSEEHTSELQSRPHLVCRLLLEKKKKKKRNKKKNKDIYKYIQTY